MVKFALKENFLRERKQKVEFDLFVEEKMEKSN